MVTVSMNEATQGTTSLGRGFPFASSATDQAPPGSSGFGLMFADLIGSIPRPDATSSGRAIPSEAAEAANPMERSDRAAPEGRERPTDSVRRQDDSHAPERPERADEQGHARPDADDVRRDPADDDFERGIERAAQVVPIVLPDSVPVETPMTGPAGTPESDPLLSIPTQVGDLPPTADGAIPTDVPVVTDMASAQAEKAMNVNAPAIEREAPAQLPGTPKGVAQDGLPQQASPRAQDAIAKAFDQAGQQGAQSNSGDSAANSSSFPGLQDVMTTGPQDEGPEAQMPAAPKAPVQMDPLPAATEQGHQPQPMSMFAADQAYQSTESTVTKQAARNVKAANSAPPAAGNNAPVTAPFATSEPTLPEVAAAKAKENAKAVRQPQLIDRMVKAAELTRLRGETRMKLLLQPAELGKMKVELRMKEDILTGRMTVESAAAHDVVTKNLSELRQALENQGIEVGEFEVHVEDGNADAHGSPHHDRPNERQDASKAWARIDTTGNEEEGSEPEAVTSSTSEYLDVVA